ncbi:FAR1-related sequence 1 [Rhynchospora pubera]|uniref:FAR1-related sequence 1 n=1 Tax=Rhynchospora pubera TaxID=906938 RepID=A0AAV8HJG6_9POAL|nr:FAR1-related sequence 1 [Rhynchospora pubera]
MVQISEAEATPEFTNEPPDPDPNPFDEPAETAIEEGIGSKHVEVEPASSDGTGPVQCPAGMEVVRTDAGRWTVSKVVLEHSHDDLLPLEVGPTETEGLLPAVGMEFDSVSAAKSYYSAYGERLGFKVKMGNGKRFQGSRILVMQGFICEKGKSDEGESAKRKRGTYKKKDQNEIELDMINEGSISNNDDCEDGEKLDLLRGRGDKVPLVNNPGHSKLLRELGIRVSRYTHEERRDIILKYMQKRNSRQVVNRTTKIQSRQALAERRLRGVGGKFLSKEEIQTSHQEDDKTTGESQRVEIEEGEEPNLPAEALEEAIASGFPLVGMAFESEEKAYEYYINYASNIGFTVRKGWWDKTSKNTTRSRTFVCSREGFKPKNESKRVRPETRTGCQARMAIKTDSRGRYRVSEFIPDHNHPLSAPLDMQLLNSQMSLIKAEVRPGLDNTASLIPAGYKNYIRVKRSMSIVKGDSEALLEYFRRMKGEDPLFYYAVQLDESDQMTNFFWANSKNMIDYRYFGDVVCLDTTFRVLNFGRPLALFLGQNHHKQIVTFGTALLYDNSSESIRWLFETFAASMGGKIPKTVLTERCENINQIATAIWTSSVQLFCAYQIYKAAVKELGFVPEASENLSRDLVQCLFHLEEEEEFISTWDSMLERENLKDNVWLCKLFEDRAKWAPPYNQHVFLADIETSLRDENLCDLLRGPLEPDKSFSSFLSFFEILSEERCQKEEQADYESNHNPPRVPPIQILWYAANVYTPAILGNFRGEYEKLIDCIAYTCDDFGSLSEYVVTLKGVPKEHLVRFDSSDGTVLCTCKRFERAGMICCHVLKVFELRNMKEIPANLISRRWRKDAKARGLDNSSGNMNVVLSAQDQYVSLYQNLYKIALKASENDEIFSLVVNQTDHMFEQVERISQAGASEKQNIGNLTKEVRTGLAPNENVIIGRSVGEIGKVKRKKAQSEFEGNKRRKDVGRSEEMETQVQYQPREDEMGIIAASSSQGSATNNNQFLNPTHLIQGQFLLAPRFGVGTAQTINNISQFGQGASLPSLQQPHFHPSNHLSQSYTAADMQALQFVGSNPQRTNQPQGSVPVWDFL